MPNLLTTRPPRIERQQLGGHKQQSVKGCNIFYSNSAVIALNLYLKEFIMEGVNLIFSTLGLFSVNILAKSEIYTFIVLCLMSLIQPDIS